MKSKVNKSIKFSLTIAVITFVLAAIFSVIYSSTLENAICKFDLILILIIVFNGIVFDKLGAASYSARIISIIEGKFKIRLLPK